MDGREAISGVLMSGILTAREGRVLVGHLSIFFIDSLNGFDKIKIYCY